MTETTGPDLLGGRYRLVRRIAVGGMGVVWQARDERLGRDVAVKLIRPEYADDPTFRERMQNEARAIAAIRSPYVVRIHDVCEEPDGAGGCRSYLVMEYVDGRPLSVLLRDGPLAPAMAAAVTAQVADALAAAHERGIVHRDVKPANVMIDAAGHVTVLDFGIARAADAVALTATDVVLGTARYITPEQVAGQPASAPSDVYALGIVAYQCLTGRAPFDADSDVAVALAHLHDPVPPLPLSVPASLAALVGAMLSKDPAVRPSAAQVARTAGSLELSTTSAGVMAAPVVAVPVDAAPADTTAWPVSQAVEPVTPTAAPPAEESEYPLWLRPVPLAIAAAVAVLAILIPVLAASGGGGGPAAVAATTPSTTASDPPAGRHSASPAADRNSPGVQRGTGEGGDHRAVTAGHSGGGTAAVTAAQHAAAAAQRRPVASRRSTTGRGPAPAKDSKPAKQSKPPKGPKAKGPKAPKAKGPKAPKAKGPKGPKVKGPKAPKGAAGPADAGSRP